MTNDLNDLLSGFGPWPSGRCIYCDATGVPFQFDHFPIPRNAGGTKTVPACFHCHNMKDRVSDAIASDFVFFGRNSQWSDDAVSQAEAEFLMGKAPPTIAILLGLLSDFSSLSPAVRVLCARRLRQHIERQLPVGNVTNKEARSIA